MPRRDYVTLDAAAEAASVTPKTIRNWITQGRLTGYRFGPRLLRIDRAELDAMARPIPTAAIGGGR